MATTVNVEIDKEGNAIVSVNGVQGKACQDLTRPLETLLGVKVSDVPTKEMNTRNANTQDNRIKQR